MIKGELVGTDALVRHTETLVPNLRAGLYDSIARLTLTLQRNIKADKLSGQVLNVRTGRLRRSINQTLEGKDTDLVSGSVGTNVSYARALEFGFTGTVTVKAHMRTIKEAFGRSIAPTSVSVGSYSRKVNMPERSFLRSALHDLGPDITNQLKIGITGALK